MDKLDVLDAVTGARMGVTADIPTLWTTGATTAREGALTATIPADPDHDRLIHLLMLSTCADPPEVYLGQLLTTSLINPHPAGALRSWVLAGQVDIPASIDLNEVTLNSGVFSALRPIGATIRRPALPHRPLAWQGGLSCVPGLRDQATMLTRRKLPNMGRAVDTSFPRYNSATRSNHYNG